MNNIAQGFMNNTTQNIVRLVYCSSNASRTIFKGSYMNNNVHEQGFMKDILYKTPYIK